MHVLSNVTWYLSHFTMSNVFRTNHSDSPPESWLNFYACNTHRPAAHKQELKSIYSILFSLCLLYSSHPSFFVSLSFPLRFLLQSRHLWLPAERGVEKVNFRVGLICYAWPVSVSTCPSFDTGWQSAWFICPGAVSQTASHGHCSQHRDTLEHQANQRQVTHDKLRGDPHSFFLIII